MSGGGKTYHRSPMQNSKEVSCLRKSVDRGEKEVVQWREMLERRGGKKIETHVSGKSKKSLGGAFGE